MELFQWSDEKALSPAVKERVEEELADVAIYCLSLANAAEIDMASAIHRKVGRNAQKYPVEKFLGRYK